MSLSIGLRTSTFGDIETYQNHKGRPKPDRVALISPHSNENPAAVPFLKALEKYLLSEGVQTETHIASGSMKRGWELVRKLGLEHNQRDVETFEAIESAASCVDSLVRARKIAPLLESGTAVAELHALARNFKTEDVFISADGFLKINGTGILMAKEKIIREIFKANRISSKECLERAVKMAGLMGFGLKDAIAELRALYRLITGNMSRLRIIELPSKQQRLPRSHPMFAYFFNEINGKIYEKSCSSASEHYWSYFHEGMEFSQNDVEAVASVILD